MWPTSLLGYSRSHSSRIRPGRPQGRSSRRAARPLAVERLEDRCLLAATLALDINPSPLSSSPERLAAVGGTVFFTAADPVHGLELWKSDGTAAGTVLVKDFTPGSTGSAILSLTNVGGTLFFTALTQENGFELWKSDGTAAGTILVKDIRPGSGSSNPGLLRNVNGTLFFLADDGVHGRELWKSDGSAAGTALVKDINPGSASGLNDILAYPTTVNGQLFFVADDGVLGTELWKSDGTAAGTVLVKDLRPGSASSGPALLTDVSGTLFFVGPGDNGEALWKSDGTTEGTVPFASSGFSSPGSLTSVSGTLFFTAFTTTAGIGRELWKSNGTAEGTVVVKDILPGLFGSEPEQLTTVNGTLFFTARMSAFFFDDRELWRSDGTPEGTVLVKDINPGSDSAFGSGIPAWLTNVSGTLFFQANDGANGVELWKSDGAEAGTVLVQDINPGSAGSSPTGLANGNGTLFFAATDAVTGTELWKSDGTPRGTALVKDINTNTAPSSPANLTNVGGTLYFTASTPATGRELWKTERTPDGRLVTVLVKDISPGSSDSAPLNLTNVNGTLYFTANVTGLGGSGRELWKSDGTPEGTVLVRDIIAGVFSSSPGSLTDVDGTLFFSAFSQLITPPPPGMPMVLNRELWKSDGTAAGTVRVKDINPGTASSNPASLTNVNGTLFFAANDGMNGQELWRSDGTADGTIVVKDIIPGVGGSFPSQLTEVSGTLYFLAGGGQGLWKSDGTADGTVAVPLPDGAAAAGFTDSVTNVNGILFFVAVSPATGTELWKTDGTPEGTALVKDIRPGPDGDFTSGPALLTNVNGALLFTAYDGIHGRELWKSDGTPEGTVMVKDIRQGLDDGVPFLLPSSFLANVGGTLYLIGDDGIHGFELWQSDGTPEGTFLVQDINPGSAHSMPISGNVSGANVGGTLFFTADDGTHGRELWVLERPPGVGVERMDVNDGSAQRSRVTSLTVTFSGLVTLLPGAILVVGEDGAPVGLDVSTSVAGGKTVAVLTFTGPGLVGGSLADGRYALVVRADRVLDGLSQSLDGDGDGTPGGDRLDLFFRLFGDGDGDGDVDAADAAGFYGTFGLRSGDPGFLGYYDYNGDGVVDEADEQEFAARLGVALTL